MHSVTSTFIGNRFCHRLRTKAGRDYPLEPQNRAAMAVSKTDDTLHLPYYKALPIMGALIA